MCAAIRRAWRRGVVACLGASLLAAPLPLDAQTGPPAKDWVGAEDSATWDDSINLAILAEVAILFPSAVIAASNGIAIVSEEHPGSDWIAAGVASGAANLIVGGLWLASELEDGSGCEALCALGIGHLALGVAEVSLAALASDQGGDLERQRFPIWGPDARLVAGPGSPGASLVPQIGRDARGNLRAELSLRLPLF